MNQARQADTIGPDVVDLDDEIIEIAPLEIPQSHVDRAAGDLSLDAIVCLGASCGAPCCVFG
jgi:hypothetical protein